MLTLLSPRTADAPLRTDGAYADPGIIALAIALVGGMRGAWGKVARSYWDGHRKGVRIQAMSSSTCLPYTHG